MVCLLCQFQSLIRAKGNSDAVLDDQVGLSDLFQSLIRAKGNSDVRCDSALLSTAEFQSLIRAKGNSDLHQGLRQGTQPPRFNPSFGLKAIPTLKPEKY